MEILCLWNYSCHAVCSNHLGDYNRVRKKKKKIEVHLQWRESTFTYTSFQLQPWLCHCVLHPLFFVFFSHFRQWHCHNYHKFYPLFRQWHCHKPIANFFFSFYFDNIIVINPFYNFLFYFLEMIRAHLTCGLAVKSYLWKILAYLTCGLAVSTLDFAESFNYTLKSPLPSGDSRLITWSKGKSTFTKLQT